jgi:hypothetical protein
MISVGPIEPNIVPPYPPHIGPAAAGPGPAPHWPAVEPTMGAVLIDRELDVLGMIPEIS